MYAAAGVIVLDRDIRAAAGNNKALNLGAQVERLQIPPLPIVATQFGPDHNELPESFGEKSSDPGCYSFVRSHIRPAPHSNTAR